MKQVLLGKGVHVTEVPSPGLGPGQVLVEAAWSFISTGTEVAGVKNAETGVIGRVMQHPKRIGQVLEMVRVDGVRKTLARVRGRLDARDSLGYSCAGRVVAAGRNVRTVAVGDVVACAGAGYACHAEVVAVHENLVAKVPEGVDLREAAGATVAAIALQGVRRADPRLGETVAVVGLGLLGQITLQLLAAGGVHAVGFDPDAQRVAEAKALGFEHVYPLVAKEAAGQAATLTDRHGADAVILTAATSTPGICQDAMEMCRRKGRVVVVGAVPLQFDRDPFYRKEIDFLISCSYGPGRYDPAYEEGGQDYPYAYVRWTENRNLGAVLDLMARGRLRLAPLISAEYPVEEADTAFARLSGGEGPRPLAVVLKYDLVSKPPEGAAEARKAGASVRLPAAEALKGRIGVGLVGVGGFCTGTLLPNLATLKDRYHVVGVCDLRGDRAQDVGRRTGAALACTDTEALLAEKDVHLVIITTRHDAHAPLAMAALRAGKHVYTEKPMAMDEAQLRELAGAVEAGDRYFMVGFNRRFSPHLVQLRGESAGRTGPLVVNYRVFADPAPSDSWIYSPAGGGRVIGEVCHMLDAFGYLVGDDVPPAEIDTLAPPTGRGGMPTDNVVTSIRYADGSLCTLTYTAVGRKSPEVGKERIEAMWDGKTFVVDDFLRSTGIGCSAGKAAGVRSKGHREELVALADYLAGRGPEPIGLAACVRATELSFRVDAACRAPAVEEGTPDA